MSTDIATYDYCAFILLFIVIIYNFRRSVHGTHRAKIMTLIVACTLCAAVCDATRVRFAGLDAVSDFRFLNINAFYLLFLTLIPPLFLLYTIASTDMWHKLERFKTATAVCCVPMLIYIPVFVINYFYPVAFEVGP